MAHTDSANRRLAYLESVLNCTSDALFVTEDNPNEEASHRICFVNEAFTLLTGYSLDDVAGLAAGLFMRALQQSAGRSTR